MEATIQPGIVQLPLEINAENFDRDNVEKFTYPKLRHYLEEKMNRPERNTIINLLGVVAARLEHYDEALTLLNKVLEEDRDNLNALTNLKWVYGRMDDDMREKQEQITQRLEELEPVLESQNDRARVLKARCLAEEGYAYAFCHGIDNKFSAEHTKASGMYDAAFKMGGDLISDEEKVAWKLGAARAKRTELYDLFEGHEKKDVELEKQFIEDIQDVLVHGDDVMKAEAWVKLVAFFHWLRRREKKEGIQNEASYPECITGKDDLLRYYRTPNPPVACADEALKLRRDHPRMMAYKARMMRYPLYLKTAPDFEASIRILDKSIEADSSVLNKRAFAYRGESYINWYLKDRKKCVPKYLLDLLIKAKDDFKIAITMDANHKDYRQLGDIWRFLATMAINYSTANLVANAVGKNSQECLEKALEYYTIATSVGGGSTNPMSHRKQGECLLDLGNFKEAAECFKQAIKTNKDDEYKMVAHSKLFYTHLKMLRVDDEHSNDELYEKTSEWLKDAVREFGEHDVAEKCFHFISSRYGRERIMRNIRCFIDICREKGDDDLASLVEKHSVA